VGIYLVKNLDEAPLRLRFLNYAGGIFAIITGSTIGIWYTFHLARKLVHHGAGDGSLRGFRLFVFGMFLFSALVIILTIIAGAVKMSCDSMSR